MVAVDVTEEISENFVRNKVVVQSKFIGLSVRCFKDPDQSPLHLSLLILAPHARSYKLRIVKVCIIDEVSLRSSVVSSAYCESLTSVVELGGQSPLISVA